MFTNSTVHEQTEMTDDSSNVGQNEPNDDLEEQDTPPPPQKPVVKLCHDP